MPDYDEAGGHFQRLRFHASLRELFKQCQMPVEGQCLLTVPNRGSTDAEAGSDVEGSISGSQSHQSLTISRSTAGFAESLHVPTSHPRGESHEFCPGSGHAAAVHPSSSFPTGQVTSTPKRPSLAPSALPSVGTLGTLSVAIHRRGGNLFGALFSTRPKVPSLNRRKNVRPEV